MAGIGFGAVTIDGNSIDNYNVEVSNGLGPRTRIVSLSKAGMKQAELEDAITFMTVGGTSGTDDPVTVAGITSDGGDGDTDTAFVSGESDVVYVAVQGTGEMGAGADYGGGASGVTMAIVADFDNDF